MKNTCWISSLVILFGVVGCAPDEAGIAETPTAPAPVVENVKPDVSLTNTYWKLIELNGAAVEPGEGKELHMILKGEDQVGGYAGCNQFTGSMTVTDDGLSVGPIASTRRMCQNVMAQEVAFLQALENAYRYSIAGEDLAIEDANGDVTMRFVAVYMP
ncbi:MAG: META domain-containing protein [Gammaproteobacteria bacterium]|jgi:putative lipoprotein|nr:META domain-containing protein [Gammaproteobacteria bacterium]